jgi:hypothetical protein
MLLRDKMRGKLKEENMTHERMDRWWNDLNISEKRKIWIENHEPRMEVKICRK